MDSKGLGTTLSFSGSGLTGAAQDTKKKKLRAEKRQAILK
jgi:hypothetical protein